MKINMFVILYWIPEAGEKKKKNTLEENWRNFDLDVSIVTANLGKTIYKFDDKEFFEALPFLLYQHISKKLLRKKKIHIPIQFNSVQ